MHAQEIHVGGLGKKAVCPHGYLNYFEAAECDSLWTAKNWVMFFERRVVSYLDLVGVVYALWEWVTSLQNIHPHRLERLGNYLDDNCNGRVDETQFVYAPWGNNIGLRSFRIRALVHHAGLMEHADYLLVRVFRLEDLKSGVPSGFEGLTEIKHLMRGRRSYTDRVCLADSCWDYHGARIQKVGFLPADIPLK